MRWKAEHWTTRPAARPVAAMLSWLGGIEAVPPAVCGSTSAAASCASRAGPTSTPRRCRGWTWSRTSRAGSSSGTWRRSSPSTSWSTWRSPTPSASCSRCTGRWPDGGWLRLSTPNLDWVWHHPLPAGRERGRAGATRRCAINRAFRGWRHQFLWNREILAETLAACGFDEVRWCRRGESALPLFRDLERHDTYGDTDELPPHPHRRGAEGEAPAGADRAARDRCSDYLVHLSDEEKDKDLKDSRTTRTQKTVVLGVLAVLELPLAPANTPAPAPGTPPPARAARPRPSPARRPAARPPRGASSALARASRRRARVRRARTSSTVRAISWRAAQTTSQAR